MQQYHLTGAKGYSGRAVRCRELDPSEVEKNLTDSAKVVGQEATIIELKKAEWRNGIKMMVVEVSDPCTDPMDPSVKWKKLNPAMLENLGDYFKVKDVLMLESIYREYNEVLPTELNIIMGGAKPVAD